jgi:hypothetical protein
LSEFGDILRGCDQANFQIDLEAGIEQVWSHIGRLKSSEFGDSFGGRDRANFKMAMLAVIESDWT